MGRDQIDGEHKVQLGLLVALSDGLTKKLPQADLTAIVGQLIEFTNVHFMSEQLLMRLYSYPDLDGHEAEHDRLLDQARALEAGIAAGDLTLSGAVLETLRTWLLDHIGGMDKGFATYLTRNGVVPA